MDYIVTIWLFLFLLMGSLKVKFQIEFTKESLNKKVLNTQKNKIGRNVDTHVLHIYSIYMNRLTYCIKYNL